MTRPDSSSLTGLLGLLLLLATGCAAIDVSSVKLSETTFDSYRRFAFCEHRPGDPVLGPVGSNVQEAVARELEARGMERAELDDADMLVSVSTRVESRIVHRDPYFWMYAAERTEEGTLTIELLDGLTGAPVWRGTGSSNLGVSAVLASPMDVELTPVDWELDWKVDEKVAAILEDVPVGD